MIKASLISLAVLALCALVLADTLKIDTTFLPDSCPRKTVAGDTVSMHYRGRLTNGKEFDASYNRGQPFSFKLGAGQVIRGWDQGLLGMCVGEKRLLTIPSDLAYGSRSIGNLIPANSDLIFETELVEIK